MPPTCPHCGNDDARLIERIAHWWLLHRLFTEMGSLTLPPHEWDDDTHRLAIHRTFELWSASYERGDRRQAKRWLDELRWLTEDATRRYFAQTITLTPLPELSYLSSDAAYLTV